MNKINEFGPKNQVVKQETKPLDMNDLAKKVTICALAAILLMAVAGAGIDLSCLASAGQITSLPLKYLIPITAVAGASSIGLFVYAGYLNHQLEKEVKRRQELTPQEWAKETARFIGANAVGNNGVWTDPATDL